MGEDVSTKVASMIADPDEVTMAMDEVSRDSLSADERRARGDYVDGDEPTTEGATDEKAGQDEQGSSEGAEGEPADSGQEADSPEDGPADESAGGEDSGESGGEAEDAEEGAEEAHGEPDGSSEDAVEPTTVPLKTHIDERKKFQDEIAALKERLAQEGATATEGGHEQAAQPDQAPPEDPFADFDLRAKITEKTEAYLDGDTEEVARLEIEIAEYQQHQAETRAIEKIRAETEANRLDTVKAEVWGRHVDRFSDTETVEAFVAMAEGLSQMKSVPMADGYLLAEERFFGAQDKDAPTPGPKAEARPDTPAKQDETRTQRRKEAVDRNADAARQQPPRTGSTGQGARNDGLKARTAFDFDSKEYANLPESKKREGRGDTVN